MTVAEREDQPNVFDVRFESKPRVGPSGFSIGYRPESAHVEREELLDEIGRTIDSYGPDELELERES